MKGLLFALLLGGFLYSRRRQIAQTEYEERYSGAKFKKDYQGVPIEVQRAISESKRPPEASKHSTAFGEKTEDRSSNPSIEHRSTTREKNPRGLRDNRMKTNREMKAEWDQDKGYKTAKRVPKKIDEDLKSDRPEDVFAFVDAFDAHQRPFIYQEIVSKPKSRRK